MSPVDRRINVRNGYVLAGYESEARGCVQDDGDDSRLTPSESGHPRQTDRIVARCDRAEQSIQPFSRLPSPVLVHSSVFGQSDLAGLQLIRTQAGIHPGEESITLRDELIIQFSECPIFRHFFRLRISCQSFTDMKMIVRLPATTPMTSWSDPEKVARVPPIPNNESRSNISKEPIEDED